MIGDWTTGSAARRLGREWGNDGSSGMRMASEYRYELEGDRIGRSGRPGAGGQVGGGDGRGSWEG